MNPIEITCPLCGKKGKIDISKDLIKNTARGLLSVNIANNIICSHSFIAYIDKNLNVRDYFYADFSISLPEISLIDKIEEKIGPSKDIFDIGVIKLNISAFILSCIIKSIFLKQKIVLISNEQFLNEHLKKFFQYITQNSFEVDLSFITRDEYNNNKKYYKDALVFDYNNILRDKNKLINPKKLIIEKKIIEQFFNETQLESSYIVLKNEILKVYTLSKLIIEQIEKERERGNSPNILTIQNELENTYKTKIDGIYLNFLIETIINYFEVSVPSVISGFFELL